MKKSIDNYALTEKLYENSSLRVYRAVQIQDHVPVILKWNSKFIIHLLLEGEMQS